MRKAPHVKHTPGPWRIRDETAIFASDQRFIAMVGDEEPDVPEYRDNARLIAACPTMAAYISRKAKEGDKEARNIVKKAGL